MSFKKLGLSLLVAVLGLGTLSGCSSSPGKSQSTGIQPSQQESAESKTNTPDTSKQAEAEADKYKVSAPIEIEWWHALESQYSDVIDEVINKFHATGTNVKVIPVYQGSYSDLNEKLIAAHAAGTLPALTVANTPYVAEYGASELCEPLDDYIAATGFDIDDFGEGLRIASSYDDKQISLPFLISTQVLFYNKDMVDAENIKLPDTWAEMDTFINTAAKVTGDTTERYAIGIPGWDHWYFETFFLNRGVKIVQEDNTTDLHDAVAVDTASNMQKWSQEGKASWFYGKDASTAMRQGFFDKKYLSVIHTTSLYDMYVEQCDFEVGMHYLPGDQTRISEIGGCVLLIPSNNSQEVKNAAWEFLQFLTGKEVNMLWAEKTGYMPTRNSVLNTDEGKAFLEKKPAFQTIFDNLDNIYPRIQHPAISQVVKIWRETMAKNIIEGGDIGTALGEAKILIDEALSDY